MWLEMDMQNETELLNDQKLRSFGRSGIIHRPSSSSIYLYGESEVKFSGSQRLVVDDLHLWDQLARQTHMVTQKE